MARNYIVQARVDPKIKEEAQEILDSLGMTYSEAINIYLRQIIYNSGIPFEIKTPEFSDEFKEAIAEADEMMKHPEKYKSYKNLAEIMEDLDNE